MEIDIRRDREVQRERERERERERLGSRPPDPRNESQLAPPSPAAHPSAATLPLRDCVGTSIAHNLCDRAAWTRLSHTHALRATREKRVALSRPPAVRQFREPPLGHVGFVWGWKPSFKVLGPCRMKEALFVHEHPPNKKARLPFSLIRTPSFATGGFANFRHCESISAQWRRKVWAILHYSCRCRVMIIRVICTLFHAVT